MWWGFSTWQQYMVRSTLRRMASAVRHQLVGSGGGGASGLGSLPEGLDGLTVSSSEAGAEVVVAAGSLRLLALLGWLEMVVTMPFLSSSKSCMWWPYCKGTCGVSKNECRQDGRKKSDDHVNDRAQRSVLSGSVNSQRWLTRSHSVL